MRWKVSTYTTHISTASKRSPVLFHHNVLQTSVSSGHLRVKPEPFTHDLPVFAIFTQSVAMLTLW